ncbi:hypothetical protein [Saccharopolyspora cebuensis]|uniref:Uncharacterized protein n=1 Tax=Saccharopolyspora cebuensis TaxID=418759 RepID=A0ABV4CK07_9PSEU
MTTIDHPLFPQSRPLSVVQRLRGPRRGPAVVAESVAEATHTAGLVITPGMTQSLRDDWSFTGTWDVRHQSSGYVVIANGPSIGLGHARDLAVLLGELDLDWTQPSDVLPLRDPAVRAAVGDVQAQISAAAWEARPARLRATSWMEFPPPYWIGQPGGEADEFFRTFAAAADRLLAVGWTDGVVGRDTAPWWDLLCAAADCRTHPEEGEMGWLPERSHVVEVAHADGWRRLDTKRWLCHWCTTLFTPTHP